MFTMFDIADDFATRISRGTIECDGCGCSFDEDERIRDWNGEKLCRDCFLEAWDDEYGFETVDDIKNAMLGHDDYCEEPMYELGDD